MRTPAPQSRDEGAVAVTVAIVLLVLFLITALVVDLGFTRSDARANQSHADFAALAAMNLDDSARQQCRRAVEYFAANAPEVQDFVDPSSCDALPLECDSSTSPVTTDPIAAGPYELLITHPVADDDPTMVQGGQAILDERDGVPCDRLKTEVRRNRAYIFAPAAGMFQGSSFGDAVVIRSQGTDEGQFASLIVLEETDCQALRTTGGGNIHVQRGVDDDGEEIPGIITVDTLATTDCGGAQNFAIVGPGSGAIKSEDFIISYGLRAGNPDKVFNPNHAPPNGDRITPRPIPGLKITRAPVDHRFNCRSSYPAPSDDMPQLPAASQNVRACPNLATRHAYIDELREALQEDSLGSQQFIAVGTANTNCPPITYDGALLTVGDDPPVVHTHGRLHILCRPHSNYDIDITNARYVVFERRIAFDGDLRIWGEDDHGAVVYFRPSNGAFDINGDSIHLRDVFVYVDSRGLGNQDRSVEIAGNTDLIWHAPVSDEIRAQCDDYGGTGLPPAGCFAPLALWSNSERPHELTGSGILRVRGTFFTPNALFTLAGTGNSDYTLSQFFSQKLRTTGTSTLELVPNPQTNIEIPLIGIGLIR